MKTMSDTIYQGQEFFRIIHEGERAGLYRVEVLPAGERIPIDVLPLPGGGMEHGTGGGRP